MKERDTIYHRSPRRKRDSIHETPDVSYIANPNVAHEHTDVSVGPIAKFVVALFIFGIIVHVLMWGLFRYFDHRERSAEPPPSPLARRGSERLPPDPRLQLAPGFGVETPGGERVDLSVGGERPELREPQAEYRVVRQMWEEKLQRGWTDRNTGASFMPIEEAKRLLLQQEAGRPSNATPAQPAQTQGGPQAAGETLPSGSSSGQTEEKRNQ